jgi:hypothetical protein
MNYWGQVYEIVYEGRVHTFLLIVREILLKGSSYEHHGAKLIRSTH